MFNVKVNLIDVLEIDTDKKVFPPPIQQAYMNRMSIN